VRIECSKRTELGEIKREAIGDQGNSPNFQFLSKGIQVRGVELVTYCHWLIMAV